MRIAASLMLALALSACAGNQQRGPRPEIIDRALRNAPGEAQPGKIVAREVEYARTAKETGQFAAARAFAGPGAVYHGRNGIVPAIALLDTIKEEPETSVQWGPKAVVISCDATLAVSQGRYQDADGIVGNYVTVWKRDRATREYNWIYDVAGPDVPQPPKRENEAIEGPAIVVTSIDAVQGLIADCPKRGEATPAPPAVSLAGDADQGGGVSPDGTLRWRWEHRTDGTKYVAADYLYQGEWQTVIEEGLTSPAE
ncbi:hypothetical protein BPTFM16_02461 [Altererythrobacter insulae]|nr:hypothetical protein BPTFM16_02461 [Altererythrobacter insulae]